jgi:hypothetical protein
LPEEEFIPPSSWTRALTPDHSPQAEAAVQDEWLYREAEEECREQVEEFAAAFFVLPVAERQQRWQELVDRCRFSPTLIARLARLKPGLAIEVDTDENLLPRMLDVAAHVRFGRLLALMAHIRELFVLRPAEQAMRRHRILEEVQQDPESWEQAAQHLRSNRPAWAKLEPVLVEELASVTATRKRVRQAKLRQASSGSQPAPNWLTYVLIGVVVGMVRLCAGSGDHRPSPPPLPPPPTFRLPEIPFKVDDAPGVPKPPGDGFVESLRKEREAARKRNDTEEVKRLDTLIQLFERADRALKPGPGNSPP